MMFEVDFEVYSEITGETILEDYVTITAATEALARQMAIDLVFQHAVVSSATSPKIDIIQVTPVS